MFASTIALFLFLSLFESLSFCQRMAARLKYRLAADAIAFDAAWEVYNRQLTWFEKQTSDVVEKAWTGVPAEKTSVWPAAAAHLYLGVSPRGDPPTNWVITAKVQWPLPNGGSDLLGYEVVRARSDRNLFRATN